MKVVIVEGEGAVLGVNLWRRIVTKGDFATRLFPNYLCWVKNNERFWAAQLKNTHQTVGNNLDEPQFPMGVYISHGHSSNSQSRCSPNDTDIPVWFGPNCEPGDR